MLPGLKIRRPTVDDIPFILDAWTKSFRKSPYAGCIRNDEFARVHHTTIAGLLGRGAEVLVATVGTEGGERIAGFAVGERGDILHYCYVKRPFRRLGIARSLVSAIAPRGRYYTHRTIDWLGPQWSWRPELARVERLRENPT